MGQARAVVVMINDPQASLRIIDAVRRVSSEVTLFVRTQYLGEGEKFVEHGADDFVAGEVEGGLELLSRVLRSLDVPRNVIDFEVQKARHHTKLSTRTEDPSRMAMGVHHLETLKVESILVTEGSPASGHTVHSLDLGRKTQALLVALKRENVLITRGLADHNFKPGDIVYVIGDAQGLAAAVEVFGHLDVENDSLVPAS